ncbi:unnamed protein product [Amoebophrya sp. A120]|nr:unnamed protein product [Amoebophrya sp. A120]|eukprot:GSA120T00007343001.1
MPREVITVQVGQCGNQIGCRFWDLALQEHLDHIFQQQQHGPSSSLTNKHTPAGPSNPSHPQYHFDDALSSFFRNIDRRNDRDIDPKVTTEIKTLKARAVLVDMEDGVVNSLLKGPLGDIFDRKQIVTDVSGSGNNWAHGYYHYGKQMYHNKIEKAVRNAVEKCDSLQCFLLLQSVGGGTGSGVGTYTLENILADNYPEYYRFVSCVTPSLQTDDVITSPYNSLLALNKMIDNAHCVLPVNNDSLIHLVDRINSACKSKTGAGSSSTSVEQSSAASSNTAATLLSASGNSAFCSNAVLTARTAPGSSSVLSTRTPVSDFDQTVLGRGPHQGTGSVAPQTTKPSGPPFGDMNLLVAQMLNHLTASMRYSGSLNLDLNEITTNLVPYPKMHFLNSSLSPLTVSKDRKLLPRSFDQMFADVALTADHSLCWNYNSQNTVVEHHNSSLGFVPSADHVVGGCSFASGGVVDPGAFQYVNPKSHVTLAQAFLVRSSDCGIQDVTRNVTRVKQKLKFLPFNEDAIKIGLCSNVPTTNSTHYNASSAAASGGAAAFTTTASAYKHSCLGLANNCGIVPGLLQSIVRKFERLYKRRAHVHHYTDFMDSEDPLLEFDAALENVRSVMGDYLHVDKNASPPLSCFGGGRRGRRAGRGGGAAGGGRGTKDFRMQRKMKLYDRSGTTTEEEMQGTRSDGRMEVEQGGDNCDYENLDFRCKVWPSVLFQPSRYTMSRALQWLPKPAV